MKNSTGKIQSKSSRLVSVVITVKDEERTISDLLTALALQTFKPAEIIIVDGGSADNTRMILREWSEKSPRVKIFLEEGLNIAQGRNLGIENAKHDIVVITDAGSIPKDDWIEKITRPILEDKSVDVVGGWFEVDARNKFEKVVAVLNVPELKDIDPEEFLPSGRSVAMRVGAWQKVGGYPEWLHRCGEDTVFGLLLKNNNVPIVFEPEALVYWRPMENLRRLFQQYLCYARGDAEAGLFLKRFMKLSGIYGLFSFLVFLVFATEVKFFLLFGPIILLIYLSRHLFRVKARLDGWISFSILYPIKVVMDLGLLCGHIDGYRRRIMGLTKGYD